jgi:O-antigen/teichoic acid export membrane protein
LKGTFLFLPTAIGYALMPSLARLAEANTAEFQRMERRVLVAVIALGLPVMTLVLMLAYPLSRLLYGEKFQDLPLTLQATALSIIPIYINIVLYRFLVAQQKNAIWSLFLIGTVILNAILCYVLIPWARYAPDVHNAAVGAVLASTLAEIVTVVFALLLLKTNPVNVDTVGRLLRSLLATGAMVIVIWWTRHLFILIPALLGVVVFSLAAWWLHVLGEEEQRKIMAIVRKKLRRAPL